jgi:hypothetical protein
MTAPVPVSALGIDLGRTAIRAVAIRGGQPFPVEVGGQALLPAIVAMSQGRIVAGVDAVGVALAQPEHALERPLTALGRRTVELGGQVVRPGDVAEALLRSVRDAAGITSPVPLVVVHSPAWPEAIRAVVAEAGATVLGGTVATVLAPHAMAVRCQQPVAVLDAGCDAEVGLADPAGAHESEVVPGGGGDGADIRVVEEVFGRLGLSQPELVRRLRTLSDDASRRAAALLLDRCRAGKEEALLTGRAEVEVPGGTRVVITGESIRQAEAKVLSQVVERWRQLGERGGATTWLLSGRWATTPLVSEVVSELLGSPRVTIAPDGSAVLGALMAEGWLARAESATTSASWVATPAARPATTPSTPAATAPRARPASSKRASRPAGADAPWLPWASAAIVALVAVVTIVVATRSDDSTAAANTYTHLRVDLFLQTCEAQRSSRQCRCEIDEYQRRFTEEEFLALDAEARLSGEVPAEARAVEAACR